MFKLKRSMALFLVLMFAVVMVFAGCGKQAETTETTKAATQETSAATEPEATLSLPIVKEPITVKVMRLKHPLNIPLNDMPMFKKLEEATNVHIEWDDVAHTAWAERLSLALASSDIPDAIFGSGSVNDTDVLNNMQLFMPLEDRINKLAPNIVDMFTRRPDSKAQSTAPDGHIYSLPLIYEYYASDTTPAIGINKTWLDNLGLAMPTTTEEFYNVLKSFKDNDPNKNGKKDEIPLTFATISNDWAGIGPLFGSFGVLPAFQIPNNAAIPVEYLQVVDDKLVFPQTQPGFKEAVQYFNKLYTEGLIDKEVFTQDATQYIAKIAQDPPAAGVMVAWTFKDMVNQKYRDEYVQLLPLKGPGGQQLFPKNSPQTITRHAFLVNAKTQYPDEIVRWANELYTEDMAIQQLNGSYGVTIEKNADGTVKFNTPPEGKDQGTWTWENATVSFSATAMYKEYEPKIPATQGVLDKDAINKAYAPFLPAKVYPRIFFAKETLDEVNPLRTDIDKFIYEKTVNWIVKGGVDAEWDAYVAQLDKMQLPKVIDIYTKAYENYYKK